MLHTFRNVSYFWQSGEGAYLGTVYTVPVPIWLDQSQTGDFLLLLFYVIQHFFICYPLDSAVSGDSGIEPKQDCCNFGIGSQTL
jgi:hypothetical protein